jgi:hypothetical protein
MSNLENTDRSRRFGRRMSIASIASAATLACVLVAAVASVGSAQQPIQQTARLDARWQPWIGCWQPAPQQSAGAALFVAPRSDAPLVCVVPATGASTSSAVNVVTVANGRITARDTIQATGQNVARTKDNCTGVERADWSANGRRLYVTSDFTCPGGIKRTSSGLFAISPTGEWVNVQGVDVGGNRGIRTLRYADAGTPSTLPSEVAEALHGAGRAGSTARAAAGAPLTTADVIEASHKLDSTVVEAWIVDRGQNFGVDASQIVALADAGVPGNVTDAMVAVSYPKAFAVNPSPDAPAIGGLDLARGGSPDLDIQQRSSGRNIDVLMMPAYSPYAYSPFDYYGLGYSPYGYSPYGYSPYGAYSPYAGFGGRFGGGLYVPPIIVLKSDQPAQPRGFVVKGQGYSRTAPGSGDNAGSTAQPRSTVSPSSGRSAPPPPPPSSGRTAHPRP